MGGKSIFRKWYWRVAACVFAGLLVTIGMATGWTFYNGFNGMTWGISEWIRLLVWPVTWQVTPVLVMAGLLANKLTIDYSKLDQSHETRCRRCSYILKGITEPRCPEWGEGI